MGKPARTDLSNVVVDRVRGAERPPVFEQGNARLARIVIPVG
jgi:hypothetical protein